MARCRAMAPSRGYLSVSVAPGDYADALRSNGAGCLRTQNGIARRGGRTVDLKFIALAIWAGTACFGLYLLVVWLAHGGLRQQATRITVFPAVLIFAHPVLATAGLWFWIAFIVTRDVRWAWCGF